MVLVLKVSVQKILENRITKRQVQKNLENRITKRQITEEYDLTTR